MAFSSGVDSTFLLKVARDELGDKCVAVTAMSCSFPQRELDEANAFCRSEGIRQVGHSGILRNEPSDFSAILRYDDFLP